MGQFRFFAPSHVEVPRETLAQAYIVGLEGIPWRSANRWLTPPDARPVEFVLERAVDESGSLCIPWHVPGHGELMLSTASLRESIQPYNLTLELARGAVNRVRNLSAEWQMIGLAVPQSLAHQIAAASDAFVQAVVQLPNPESVAEQSRKAIGLAVAAGDRLCAEYTRQSLAARHQTDEKLATLLGCHMPPRPLSDAEQSVLTQACNAVAIPFPWRDVEQTAGKYDWSLIDQQVAWCRQQGVHAIAGPLLRVDAAHLPDWFYLWEDDFEQIQAYLGQYIRAAVSRYRGAVQLWNCAARMNVSGAITLTEEQRLRLLVNGVEEIRRLDNNAPIILTFDQPWAEYLATNERDLSPLHVADSLVRADLGVAGIGVEMNIGYSPGGTHLRELIEFSRQLDRWSILGVPLIVFLTLPSNSGASHQSRKAVRSFFEDPDPRQQRAFAERLIPLLLAKPFVHGVIWSQLSDADPHEFAHGGLLDEQGRAKPIVEFLASFRKQHLA